VALPSVGDGSKVSFLGDGLVAAVYISLKKANTFSQNILLFWLLPTAELRVAFAQARVRQTSSSALKLGPFLVRTGMMVGGMAIVEDRVAVMNDGTGTRLHQQVHRQALD
jgi:hypothetical protein